MHNNIVPILSATLVFAGVASAQGTISTIAGGSGFLDNIPAIQARFDSLQAIAVDPQGNAFISETYRIRRIDAATGTISAVAGTGDDRSLLIDGPSTQVNVYGARNFHFDANRNLLFSDCSGIRKLNVSAGTIKTVVASNCGSSNGPLGVVSGFGIDATGNYYVSDEYGGFVRRVDAATGSVTVVAGNGQFGDPQNPTGDGAPAIAAPLVRPHDLAIDAAGNVYVAESYWIRRVDAGTGLITTIAGRGSSSPNGGDGGPASQAGPMTVEPMACDPPGNLYFGDANRIRRISSVDGIITTVAGTGQPDYNGDGRPATQTNIAAPLGVFVDSAENLWLADTGNSRLREVTAATGLMHTVAGVAPNGDGGPALGARLAGNGVAFDPQGDIYIADARTVRRVDHSTGVISTVMTSQALTDAGRLTFDATGNLYISDSTSVKRVDGAGIVSAVAGTNQGGFSGDGGPAASAHLANPGGISFDQDGNLFIADSLNFRVRRVATQTGIITTVAGNGGPNESYSKGGVATDVPIGIVTDVVVGPDNQLYIAAPGGVLKVDANGMISLFAGTGLGSGQGCAYAGYAGDGGPATLSSICNPVSLVLDPDGNLFVGEFDCGCVRRIAADTGIIQTVAGTGRPGISGDSIPATTAALNVGAMAWAGNVLYVADQVIPPGGGMSRIRKVNPPTPPPLPQPPRITRLLDAVDLQPSYSPGAIVSFIGNYLASPNPASVQIGSDGKVTTILAGVQALFDGIAAPLLYVSAAQVNAVVPYGARIIPHNIPVQLQTPAGTDSLSDFSLTPTSLAIFDGLVFNPDGTLNSMDNPAPKGATVVVYGTGMGQTMPPGVDGAIVQGPDLPRPVAQFTPQADVAAVPGLVEGAMQANVPIPASARPGRYSLVLSATSYIPELQKYHSSTTLAVGVYLLSTPPSITGINPSSPQIVLGEFNTVTINGNDFNGPVSVEFFHNGTQISPEMTTSTTPTSLTMSVNFNTQPGEWSVEVVNAANQHSNRFVFTVQPAGPPSIDGLSPILFATSGIQAVYVTGTNFDTPLTVDLFLEDVRIATLSGSQIVPANIYTSFTVFVDFKGIAGGYGIEVVDERGLRSKRFNFTVWTNGSVVIGSVSNNYAPISTDTYLLTVGGANFQNDLSVDLYLDGARIATLSGPTIAYYGASLIGVFIDFKNQPGTYALQVTNPDGARSNIYTFQVQPRNAGAVP